MTARLGRLCAAILAAGMGTAALAGGPIYTFDYASRTPYAWTMASWNEGEVPVYTDLGSLGILSNARAGELVSNAVAQWSSVPTTSFRAAIWGDLASQGLDDITAANVTSVIGTWNGGGIHVIYDNDGSIMQNFFGLPPTGVLGITSIDFIDAGTPEILEAWMVLSGPGVHATDPDGIGFSGVVTHEFGHAINLAHSQANGAVENPSTFDAPQPSGCPAPWTGTVRPSQVETMYPISTPEPDGSGAGMATVDRIDDMAAVSDIYPAAGYPKSRAMIRGKVFDASGHEVTGVNVIARNVADPFNDFSSYISGQVSKGQAGPDGSFQLNGLTPGASYVLYVDNLLNGAFSVPRFVALPGPEEYFNGAMESGDGSTDDRCAWTTVTTAAPGLAVADITLNHLPGAPTLLQAPNTGVRHRHHARRKDRGGILRPVRARLPVGPGHRRLRQHRRDGHRHARDLRQRIEDRRERRGRGRNLQAGRLRERALDAAPRRGRRRPLQQQPGRSNYGFAEDISGDGSTVVGLSYGPAGCYAGTTRGFKWTAAGGTVQLPKLDTFDRPGAPTRSTTTGP
jgi:hypothetical protein